MSELKKQLKSNGASDEDIEELAKLAENLGSMRTKGLSESAKKNIASVPDRVSKDSTRSPFFWFATSMAATFAVASFVFIGQGFFESQNNNAPASEQASETEREEIEMILEETSTELQDLQQAEEVEPEKIEEAEQRYEEALDRLDEWEAENDDYEEDRGWRDWRRSRNRDVQSESDERDSDDYRRSSWRNYRRR